MAKILEWTLPIRTISEANSSEHWTAKHKRHKNQKGWVWYYFKRDCVSIPLPCTIRLTRVGKRRLDSDNLPVSMKYVRDEIANQMIPGKAAGQADNDPRIDWQYDQVIGKNYAVIVSFEA